MSWSLLVSGSALFRHVCDLCLCMCLFAVVVVLASGHTKPLTTIYLSDIIRVESIIWAAEVTVRSGL